MKGPPTVNSNGYTVWPPFITPASIAYLDGFKSKYKLAIGFMDLPEILAIPDLFSAMVLTLRLLTAALLGVGLINQLVPGNSGPVLRRL